jgi:type II secretory pathway component GspD/PulD (secretin)
MIVRKASGRGIVRVGAAMAAMTAACAVQAQEGTEKAADKPAAQSGPRGCPSIAFDAMPMKTFYLRNGGQNNDANEILTGLRLMLDPVDKLYLVPSQNAILLRACPDEFPTAQKLIDDIDRPRKKYRLTFTLTETDAGKKIGVQHVAMFVEEGQRSTLKSGSKIPIVTGSYAAASNTSQQQMTYLDIGTNFDATAIAAAGDEITLKAKVEQSSVAEEKSGVGPQDPIVRQTVLESSSLLTQGKPQVLGAVDISGTTRKLEIEVVADPVK